ncbi:MAG: PAS domain S-box protein, partial [Promethearchaeota archaeon]
MAVRVLMVDDDPVHLQLSQRFLTRQSPDYEVVSAETPEQAMNLLLEQTFDAAVCDIDMGDGQPTGLDILEQVRSSGLDVPVIIFTGKSREEIAIQALNLGADYYIRKSSSRIEGLYAELSYYILTSVEKRRTKRALAESEKRLRIREAQLAEAQRIARMGHWDWDIINDNIDWSDEIYRIFGLKPQEFSATYDAFLASVHEEDREFVRTAVDEAITENKPYSIDHRVVHPDGQVVQVHEEGEVTFDKQGTAIKMMGTVQEIDERSHHIPIHEDELMTKTIQIREDWWEAVFDSSPNAIAIFDTDGLLITANTSTLELFGVSDVENLIGFNIFDDPNTPEFVKTSLKDGKIVKNEGRFDFSKVKVHKLYDTIKTGTMYLDSVYSPVRYENEKGLHGYIVHIQDVTDRSLAEQALVESRESFRELYNNALVGLFRIRISDGMILECNDQFAKSLGLEDKDALVDNSTFFKNLLTKPKRWNKLKEDLIEKGRIVTELPVTPKEDQRLWMRFSLSIWPEKGYIEGVMSNITKQKEALEMLKKQKEELSDFAHSMSHDLKNIFHNMLGFIELVEEEQNFSHLSRMRSLLTETSQMVDHSVSLADAGLIIEEKDNVKLDPLVKEVAESLIPENVEYAQAQLPVVKADERKVSQIFRNLFDNAIKHG